MRSRSRRASMPMRLIISPPLPTRMPFCPSRSTYTVACRRSRSRLGRSNSSQITPTAWGISSRVRSRTFSRTNSATMTSSASSVPMPSGNQRGPSGKKPATTSTNASTLKPSVEETTISSSKSTKARAASSCLSICSGPARSALVRTSTLGALAAATRSATQASPWPIGALESITKAITSTSASSPRALLLSSEPRPSLGLWMPGVSTITSWQSSRLTTARRRRRVVWATGEVMATFSP